MCPVHFRGAIHQWPSRRQIYNRHIFLGFQPVENEMVDVGVEELEKVLYIEKGDTICISELFAVEDLIVGKTSEGLDEKT